MIALYLESIVYVLCYQPANRISLKGTFIFATYANDTNGSNWGKNIALPYNAKNLPREYGNEIAQMATEYFKLK